MAAKASGDEPVIIKKYANRRLYNTQSSSYITLDDLARMTREGVEFQVLDAKTGNDITHAILTQIIMEEESSGGEQMLPVSFLRQLISMYGNSMQAMVPSYLEATMENFRTNQAKLHEAWKGTLKPDALTKMAETNMKMFQAAATAWMPGAAGANEAASPAAASDADEMAELRAQMARMQDKLDKMGD